MRMLKRFASAARFGFETFLLGRVRPYLFGVVITDRCNLDCFYCEGRNKGLIQFTFEEACEALEQAYRRGHRSLYFTGGEPMIWHDGDKRLRHVVNHAHELGFFDIFVFTNGTMPLDIPECSFIVTIDGHREIHNAVRLGTYDAVIENVRQASTRNVFASMTVTRENMGHLEAYVRDITATHLFRGISFNLLTHWPEVVAAHGLSPRERVELLDDLWRLKRSGFPIVLSRAAYQAMRRNDWKRPIPQIELATPQRVFMCCRDLEHPEICAQCGYANCVEVSQILALKPSAIRQVLAMT